MNFSSRSLKVMCVAGAIMLPAISVWADTVYVKSGTDVNGFPTKNVTITKIAKEGDGESLFYTTESGASRSKPLDQVVKIEAEGETAFTQAEVEFVKGNLKAAGDDYRKAMANTTKDWIKHRADVRLLGISAKTGDFLGAVSGFVEMARKDPASAPQHKPAVASAKPDQLDGAIASVNKGLGGASQSSQRVLLPFLVELYNSKGDSAKATATLADLTKLGKSAAASSGNTVDAGTSDTTNLLAKQAEAGVALSSANKAFADKQYDQVISAITSHSRAFTDPDAASKALYLIAEAKAAQANTPEALSDAALAYMRVVAHFKALPGAPIAESLYKTGEIEEKLQKPSDAVVIYKQIISEYKDSKSAQDAQAALARINKG